MAGAGGQGRPGLGGGGSNRSHSPGRSLQQQRRTEPGIQNGGGAAAAPIPQAEGSARRLDPRDSAGSPDRGWERGRAGFGGTGAGMPRARCSTAGGGTENAACTTFLGGSTREVVLTRKGASAPWQSLMTSRAGRSRHRAHPAAGPGETRRPCPRFRDRGVPRQEGQAAPSPPNLGRFKRPPAGTQRAAVNEASLEESTEPLPPQAAVQFPLPEPYVTLTITE